MPRATPAERARAELKKLIDPDGELKPWSPSEWEEFLAPFRPKAPAPKVPERGARRPAPPAESPRKPGGEGG